MGEYLAETNLPDGAFSILPCHLEDANALSTDERLKYVAVSTPSPIIRMLSFTGSAKVGWQLKKNAGKMKVALELGGNASCILTESADLSIAIPRLIFGSFYANGTSPKRLLINITGQSCISVQHIYVHKSLVDEFTNKFVEATGKIVMGNPYDEKTFLGPIITLDEAKRLESWIQEATSKGRHLVVRCY